MNYTPFATLTDNELLHEVWNKKDANDLEIELAERLDYYMEYAATLLEDMEQAGIKDPDIERPMKYKEAA